MSDPTAVPAAEPAWLSWAVSHKRVVFGVALFLAGLVAGAVLF